MTLLEELRHERGILRVERDENDQRVAELDIAIRALELVDGVTAYVPYRDRSSRCICPVECGPFVACPGRMMPQVFG